MKKIERMDRKIAIIGGQGKANGNQESKRKLRQRIEERTKRETWDEERENVGS